MLQYPNNIYGYVLSSFFSGGGRVGKVVSRVKGEARISTLVSKRKNEKERMEEKVYNRVNEWTSDWMREIYVSQLTYCKQRRKNDYKITFLNWASIALIRPEIFSVSQKWTRSIDSVNSWLYFQFRLFYRITRKCFIRLLYYQTILF